DKVRLHILVELGFPRSFLCGECQVLLFVFFSHRIFSQFPVVCRCHLNNSPYFISVEINSLHTSVLIKVSAVKVIPNLIITTFYGNTAMRRLPGTKQLIHPVGISPFSFWISLNYLTNVSITKERLSAIYPSRLIIPIRIFRTIQKFGKHGVLTDLLGMIKPYRRFCRLSLFRCHEDNASSSL